MNAIDEIAWQVLLIVLRIGLPLGFTLILSWWLRKLDLGWKAAAELQPHSSKIKEIFTLQPPCWELKPCSNEERLNCKAYHTPENACWQVFREGTNLKGSCLGCNVFIEAPVPLLTTESELPIREIQNIEKNGGDL